jgi:transposase InsO family protein
VQHANARLTVHARKLLVQRVAAGWPQARVAEQLGVSRQTVAKWWARYLAGGEAALADRSSRPRRSPNRTPARLERRVLAARRRHRAGPLALAPLVGVPASTIGRILRRHGLPLLRQLDLVTGLRVRSRATDRRYEHRAAGDLVHVDVKKLGRVPAGGGWRARGRDATVDQRHKKVPLGYDYLHSAVDDRTRLAYTEALPDEKDPTCAAFLARAMAFFRGHGIRVRRLLTDNALVYRRGRAWTAVCSAFELKRRFIKPGCPWTNGKVERFHRTLLVEWAYRRPYRSNQQRLAALDGYLHRYNTQRGHTAHRGQPPISALAA